MRVGHRFRSDAPGLSSTDANDRFMRSLCAQWGASVLSRYPRLDQETLEFVIWVLDPSTDNLVRALANIGIKVESILQEVSITPENQAAALAPILCRPGLTLQTCAAKALSNALESLASSDNKSDMARGLHHVTRTYGLSEDECALAFFLASVSAWPHIERFFDSHLECDRPSGRKYLMAALGMTHDRLRKAISGKLSKIGILDITHTWLSLDSDYVQLFTDPSETSVLKNLYRTIPAPDISTDTLGVDQDDIGLMTRLIKSDGDAPVHVLLYGAPGTGKTTLARGLVHENGLDGLEVMGRSEGTIKQRRGALEACLHMSEGSHGRVVVVDEADRLLNTGSSWMQQGESSDKAWMNDILERPGLRCIWIANDTSEIDPAVRRRIDFSLKLPVPDLRMRRSMLESVLRRKRIKRHFSAADLRCISRDYTVSPAVMAAAADTASLSQESSNECLGTFIKALDSQLRLAGMAIPTKKSNQSVFLKEGVNIDMSLEAIEAKVQTYDMRWRNQESDTQLPAMNLLFHGAPGTGKSFTARHLADLIDRPVLVKRASDLLGPFVGMSEQNVAEAFAQARNAGAVLVIDEIDSFLYKRAMAQRIWEANLVSEFLVQLEQGPGMVIGTTNRLDAIDEAARRRFLVRAEYRFLQADQIVGLYKRVFGGITSGQMSIAQVNQLKSIKNGTAAGFFSVLSGLMMSMDPSIDHDHILNEIHCEFAGLSMVGVASVGAIGFS